MDARGRAFWLIVSVFSLAGALFACLVAFVWRDLTGAGTPQLAIALVGLVPTFGLLAQSIDGRGHPARWFAVSAAIYGMWFVVATAS